MTKNLSSLAASMIALLVAASPALALSSRTFVSGAGSDAGSCPLATPCRTFAYALTQTAPGGEITVLDTAGYGPVTISQPVSIISPDGVTAFISVPSGGGTGVTVNASGVSLRGLTIDGGGVGSFGIQFNSNGPLIIENCVIWNLINTGIFFAPNGVSNLLVSNTLIANTQYGLQMQGATGGLSATINRVEVNNNSSIGIYLHGGLSGVNNATVSESVATNNGVGFKVDSVGNFSTLTLFHSVAANNGVGIQIGVFGTAQNNTNATVTVAQSMVTANTTAGWQLTAPAVIQTYGDNYFNNNGANVGSLTSVTKQ